MVISCEFLDGSFCRILVIFFLLILSFRSTWKTWLLFLPSGASLGPGPAWKPGDTQSLKVVGPCVAVGEPTT